MTDIVELLRNADLTLMLPDGSIKYVNHVAADEIERLREALRDIACECEDHCDDSPYGHGAITPNCCRNFARAALGGKE